MAIEAQRYPKKENPITSEEELVVELQVFVGLLGVKDEKCSQHWR